MKIPEVKIKTTDGNNVGIREPDLEAFVNELNGITLFRGNGRFEKSRKVFNDMIDKKPALIVRCTNVNDVRHAVEFANEHNALIAVRGGGHSVAGKSTCDSGILIDLSVMKDIQVYPENRTARAESGLRLQEFDEATAEHGLATTMGIVSNTGIAGLTLGGGLGWLNGKYGLTCDNLVSADVVTAGGRLVKASEEENPDLFWGIRGGGGNFGVVTSFEYRLHPVKQVLGGMLLYDLKDVGEVLIHFDEYSHTCPDEVSTAAALLTSPDGNPVVAVLACHCGDLEKAEKDLEPLCSFGSPLANMMNPIEYIRMQQLLDESFPYGRQHYWKSNFIKHLNEAAIDVLVEYALKKPSPWTAIVFQQMHGAAAHVDPGATAFAHRADQFDMIILSQWEDPADADENIRWTRELWETMRPYTEEGVYANNLGEEGTDRVRAAFGPNYERLKKLKKKYDPDNLFRLNQNVKSK